GGRYGPAAGGNNNYDPYSSRQSSGSRDKMIVAHGVLAALAFVMFFPIGAIMIRLGSFRGAWLFHGLFQMFAYIVYIVAFGIGIWMINSFPVNLLDRYHPIIGIVVFALLFFQPILGFIHHHQYKRYSRRTVWSYGHIWLGRIAITLGMINGGLGMLLAREAPAFLDFVPTRGQVTAYSVIAGIMWLLWIVAVVVGEKRRSRTQKELAKTNENGMPPPYKEHE
ncbi:hypothetical protein P153DRAFT_258216, partial [Dothidotthia symphoricarpi CBS 119687]